MFTDWYIEALLVDTIAAEEIFELWDAGHISEEIATIAWAIVALCCRV
jgi:hypothetical protein